MRKRTEVIREWIDARKERGEITKCMFYITVPKDIDIYKDETIRKIEGTRHLKPGNWRRRHGSLTGR